MPNRRTCGRSPTSASRTSTSTVIATRGERLVLTRVRSSGRDQRPEAFHTMSSTSSRSTPTSGSRRVVAFDLDDIDAAFAELDARYLAGEAAAHAHTWSVDRGGLRRAQPARTPRDDAGLGEHRPPAGTAFAPGDLIAYIRAAWDVTPDISIYIEAVHRLSDLGAVVTHAAHGTSQEGFDAEWRVINLLTVEGDMVNRCELFDEADLDAALARFDELSRRHRGWKTRQAKWTSASWRTSRPATGTRMAEILADDFSSRRSPAGRERRDPARSGCRDRKTCGRPPTSGSRT